jgi:predicted unusual protein kinase regulating ubiquinone biosynthesis (AarF/ABC1/UbiB family)
MEAASYAPSLNEIAAYPPERRRYRRIIRFFSLNFARFLFWEVFLRPLVGEKWIARGREARYRRMARRFRGLAIDLGGVMIKLGQFISTRVDILPESILQELTGLQDEVPPVPFEQIEAILEEQLGALRGHISDLRPQALAAASFGQVHQARLDGESVVLKVQRPHIRGTVYTDLAALGVVARWAMRWGFIRRRADVPKLLDEFARTLWEELDYLAELSHAERFARMFEGDMGVYVPKLYRQYCGRRLLVMEDVGAIKINDYAALEAAGIDRKAVARRVLNTYLTQVFRERFFHADPHPGNIFIYPLSPDEAASMDLGGVDQGEGRPFYVIFVDYGMVGRLSPALVETLRQSLIALGLRDARGMVESYERMGLLMPGADKERIIEATRRAFDLVWGLDMSEIGQLSYEQVRVFGQEFGDILFSLPFRIPQDLIYLGRCTGILSGMCTGLDPQFDPWREMQPYVSLLLKAGALDEGEGPKKEAPLEQLRAWLTADNLRALLSEDNLNLGLKAGRDYGLRALQLPILADELLRKADRGELQTRLKFDGELEARFQQLERGNRRANLGLLAAGLCISGAVLWSGGALSLAGGFWLGGALLALWSLRV